MQTTHLENQEAQPIDQATRVALEQARAEIERGEGVTLEQARIIVNERHQAWRKAQQEVVAA